MLSRLYTLSHGALQLLKWKVSEIIQLSGLELYFYNKGLSVAVRRRRMTTFLIWFIKLAFKIGFRVLLNKRIYAV